MWIDPANKLADDLVVRQGLTLDEVKAGHKKRNWVPLMRGDEVIEYPADQTTLTKRYTEESIRYIQANKEEPFFLYLPHTMVHLPLAVSEAFKGRTGKLIWDAIEEVDWSVGEILKSVKEAGIAEKTLVIFTSDNGAAVGSSLPLRARKASVYDGGIREPTLMWWPGKIPARSVCKEVAASIDILPTLAALTGAKLPERKLDGHDIWPLMAGQEGAKSPHEAYVLMHGPGTVRAGKWKFYPWAERKMGRDAPIGRKPSPLPVQLYDTTSDIGETKNLAGDHPDVVKRLQSVTTPTWRRSPPTVGQPLSCNGPRGRFRRPDRRRTKVGCAKRSGKGPSRRKRPGSKSKGPFDKGPLGRSNSGLFAANLAADRIAGGNRAAIVSSADADDDRAADPRLHADHARVAHGKLQAVRMPTAESQPVVGISVATGREPAVAHSAGCVGTVFDKRVNVAVAAGTRPPL